MKLLLGLLLTVGSFSSFAKGFYKINTRIIIEEVSTNGSSHDLGLIKGGITFSSDQNFCELQLETGEVLNCSVTGIDGYLGTTPDWLVVNIKMSEITNALNNKIAQADAAYSNFFSKNSAKNLEIVRSWYGYTTDNKQVVSNYPTTNLEKKVRIRIKNTLVQR